MCTTLIIRNSKTLRHILIYSMLSKSLNTLSLRSQSDYVSHESSKYMKKLLTRNAKAKKKWFHPHLGAPNEVIGTLFKGGKKVVSPMQRLRANQISHVLYDKISELINSEELSKELSEKQVLVTTVKMLDDFSGINVYWDCNRSDAAEVETLLQSCDGKLRSLLISYHVLGRIPPLTFVKDKSFSDLSLLNQLFEVADYGPNYVPSSHQNNSQEANQDGSSAITTKVDVGTVSAQDLPVTDNLARISQNITSSDNYTRLNKTDPPLLSADPEQPAGLNLKFRSDIYGLPRDKLYEKVLAQKTKGRYQEPSNENALGDALKAFESKQLNTQKDKIKIKASELLSSKKRRQMQLEEGFVEFQSEREKKDKVEDDLVEN